MLKPKKLCCENWWKPSKKSQSYAVYLQTPTEIENDEGKFKTKALNLVEDKIQKTETELRTYASAYSEGVHKYDDTRKIDDLKQKYDQFMALKK